MITRERKLLEQIIKSWAQDHTQDYIIADYTATPEGMSNTSGFLTWLIQECHTNLDLLSLADRIELFLEKRRSNKQFDGMCCKKCHSFTEFAEPNQEDGSMVCWSCRNNPYV